MTSVVGLESARVGVFCGSGDIATTPNGLFDLSDTQEQHLNG